MTTSSSHEIIRNLSAKARIIVHQRRPDIDNLIPSIVQEYQNDTLLDKLPRDSIRPRVRKSILVKKGTRDVHAEVSRRGDFPLMSKNLTSMRLSMRLSGSQTESKSGETEQGCSSTKLAEQLAGWKRRSSAGSAISLKRGLSFVTTLTRRKSLEDIQREAWCALYCGNSHEMKDRLMASARRMRIGWEAEVFDW